MHSAGELGYRQTCGDGERRRFGFDPVEKAARADSADVDAEGLGIHFTDGPRILLGHGA